MKQYKPIKGFDALAFKEKAQRELYLKTRHMTHAEEMEFYRIQARKGPFSSLYRRKRETVVTAAREKRTRYKAK
jgi:hypothetical protein